MRTLQLSLFIAGFAVATPAFAQEEPVAFKSGYLGQPVAGGHIITIKGKLGGAGSLHIDPNTFTLNAFGDIISQTEMGAAPIAIEIQRLRSQDPSGKGRRLYILKNAPGGRWNLILPGKDGGQARLVIIERDATAARRPITRVVPLEALGAKPRKARGAKKAAKKDKVRGKPRSQLGRDAKYSASFKNGELIVTATGTAPTVNFTIALEEGKKPGEYEFWWIPPDGPTIMILPPPYKVEIRTAMKAPPKTVVVRDQGGKHTIPVS